MKDHDYALMIHIEDDNGKLYVFTMDEMIKIRNVVAESICHGIVPMQLDCNSENSYVLIPEYMISRYTNGNYDLPATIAFHDDKHYGIKRWLYERLFKIIDNGKPLNGLFK